MHRLPIVDPAAPAACDAAATPVLSAVQPVNPARRRGTFAMVSLGCPKNLVDSERMLGLLREDGWQLVPEPQGSDLVVVNTCAFIDASRQESYGAVSEMLELKKAGGTRGVIVAGCLAERQKEKLFEELLTDSEHTLPTPHPKLHIARARAPDMGALLEGLVAWTGVQEGASDELVRKKLHAWIPEYTVSASPRDQSS